MKVIVVEYNPEWIKKFEIESELIQNQIGSVVNQIHHIGSTSVPGLMAKPVIDILLDVKSLDGLDKQASKLEQLGYEAMGEYGIPGRRYFRKGGYDRTHHIHAFKSGDANLVRHIAFRDYLRDNKEVATEYGKLKFSIVANCQDNIEHYSVQKDPFIKHHEALAIEWFANKYQN